MKFHTCENDPDKKDQKQQTLVKMWRKRNPCTLLIEIQDGTAIMETWGGFQNIKN